MSDSALNVSFSRYIPFFQTLLLMLVCAGIWPTVVVAKSGSIPAVMLIAPEEVRPILAQHFVLPDELLKNEIERGVFMRRAMREIPALLETEGYFSSKVSLREVMHSGTLVVQVEPGILTRVAAVEIEFQGDLALAGNARNERVQSLRQSWLLPVGMPFSADVWDHAKTDVLTRLMRQEYAAARIVDSVAKVNPLTAQAHLRVVLDAGVPFKFGAVQVNGLQRYPESMVTRYASFKQGDAYDRDQLLVLQTRLQNLAQFSSVVVTLDTSAVSGKNEAAGEAVSVPVKIQIVEAQSRKLAVGLGYSTNNGTRGELNYLSNNFLDRAWSLSSALVLEQNRQTFTAGVDTLPNPQGFRLLWNASGERTTIQGLETLRDKFGVTRSHTVFGNETNIGLNWQQELRIPNGGLREVNQALVLDWRWIRRAVDDPLQPMSGSLTECRIGAAGKAFMSDQDFVRSTLRQQTWIRLNDHNVVSLRAEGGYTATPTRVGIPQEYLFRVGGTQTVRGFAYQSLGVHEANAVVGGRVMTTASAEYTHWFSSLGMAVFADAGDAADTLKLLHPIVGYGVGARWRSPVGPLALDVARSKHIPDLHVHFAIAVAF